MTTLTHALQTLGAPHPRRPLPLPYSREAILAEAAHARCQFAARTLAEVFTAATKRGAVVCSGKDLGEALDLYLTARAEERATAEVIRSPRPAQGGPVHV